MDLITSKSESDTASESYRLKSGKLVKLSTKITPLIVFEPNEALLEIRGKCTPLHCLDFFKPLSLVLDHYNSVTNCSLVVNLRLECFSATALKCLFEIFRKLERIQQDGSQVNINWYVETGDYHLLEIGKDYADLLNLHITFIAT